MSNALKIQKRSNKDQTDPSTAIDAGHPLIGSLTSPVTPSGLTPANFYGVVGGKINNAQPASYNQTVTTTVGTTQFPIILAQANFGAGDVNVRIVRQKGSGEFLVTSTGAPIITAPCVLANNVSGTLNTGEMRIVINDGTNDIALKRLTNKFGIDFDGNRYFLNFFDADANAVIKSGADSATWTANNDGTIQLVITPHQP